MHVDGFFSSLASLAVNVGRTAAKAAPHVVRAIPQVVETYAAYRAAQQSPPLAPVDAMTGASPYYPQAPQYAQAPVYEQPPLVQTQSLLETRVAGIPIIPVAALGLVALLLLRR